MLHLLDATWAISKIMSAAKVESCLQSLQESTEVSFASIIQGLENNKLWKLKCCNDLTHMHDTQVWFLVQLWVGILKQYVPGQ